jgi:hypothetical protein
MLAKVVAELAAVKLDHLRDALRKAADRDTPVAEHHAAGTVAVDQRVEHGPGSSTVAAGNGQRADQ